MELRLRSRPHVLTGEEVWSLWRVVDGKAEANGFTSANEARTWAADAGHTVER